MGNLLESVFPTPKEEFPPTGVRSVDEITNNVKGIIALLEKPEKMLNEFKYRALDLKPPQEVTELQDKVQGFADAPKAVVKKHVAIFEEIPRLLQNPQKILQDPEGFKKKVEEIAGAPEKVKQDYNEILGEFKVIGEDAKTIANNADQYVDNYKKMVDEEYQKVSDYLQELPGIVPTLKESVEKMKTLEQSLQAELTKFQGGLCSAARSAHLIKHNLNSLEKYRKKYESEIELAVKVADEAMEKKKKVDELIAQARTYQQEAEKTIQKLKQARTDLENMQNNVQDWKAKYEDLQQKQGAIQDVMKAVQSGDVQEFVGNAFTSIKKGFF